MMDITEAFRELDKLEESTVYDKVNPVDYGDKELGFVITRTFDSYYLVDLSHRDEDDKDSTVDWNWTTNIYDAWIFNTEEEARQELEIVIDDHTNGVDTEFNAHDFGILEVLKTTIVKINTGRLIK